ncbi:hypothetical protein QMK19_35170 [Streptomyces sp. H10-C2]|uniref:hypothetical protein n=1 Tax=unclassified Streptomyces TaxID=2593676 RepID=UPI0024BAD59B|nr:MULTISPECIES: hypothetical protein [unclassified Streptomyces]MDJ0345876.1 hypothetical protein [Streptomyces sp. PH10-H1]MDJ0374725.1 hypothetical protein [Streptomyces sp. H10-C2]
MPESKRTSRPLRSVPRARTVTKATPPAKKAPKPACKGRRREVARYAYADAEGLVVGEKTRKECAGCATCQAAGKPEKFISWTRPTADGLGNEPKMPQDPPLYRLPELLDLPGGSTVYIVEGEKSADRAAGLGLVATTKPGSGGTLWNTADNRLFAGHHVVIIADNDPTGYKSAFDIRACVLPVAASVAVVRTPVPTKGADLVDHLDAGLMLDALEVVPETLDPKYVPQEDDQEQPELEQRQLQEAEEPYPGDDGRPNRKDEYIVRHGELVKVSRKLVSTDIIEGTKTYDVNFDVVLGCAARIVRVEVDDTADDPDQTSSGEEEAIPAQTPTSAYVLELIHPKELDRPRMMRVDLPDFDSGRWLHDLPWTNVTYKGSKAAVAMIASAIRAVSPDSRRVPVYGASGWRQDDDGRWMFVHAGGGIDFEGHRLLRTAFPGRLRLVSLPPPATNPAVIRGAALKSLGLVDTLPTHAIVPLLGLAHRAPFGHCPSSICMYGLPGSVKTGIATIATRHFAPELDRNTAMLSISGTGSTQAGMTEATYLMKDVLVLADDSAPDRSVREAATRTSQTARTQSAAEGKLKMDSPKPGMRRKLAAQRGPRGSFIQTSEVLASADSGQQRMLTIEMIREEINLDQVIAASKPEVAESCSLLTASYIRWVAERYPVFAKEIKRLDQHYADVFRPSCGDRPAEHIGRFAAGWHMLLRFLQECGALSAEEAAAWWSKAWTGLLEAVDRERELLADHTNAQRVLKYFMSAINSKRAHLVGPDGACPADRDMALRWGWSPSDNIIGPDSDGLPVLKSHGTQLGVVTMVTPEDGGAPEERLWLDHVPTTRAAIQEAKAMDVPFNVEPSQLTSDLRLKNLIRTEVETLKSGRERKVNPRQPMPGGRRRVWDLAATAVQDSDGSFGTGLNHPDVPPAPNPDPFVPDPPASPSPLAAASIPAPSPTLDIPDDAERAEEDPLTQLDLFAEDEEPQADAPAPSPGAPQVPQVPQDVAEEVQEASPAQAATTDTQEAPAVASQPAPAQRATFTRQRATSPADPWRAAVAVADVDGLHLPDGTVVPLPAGVDQLHAGHFADAAHELGLGHGGGKRGTGPSAKWRPDTGMVYITDALAAALGLPELDGQKATAAVTHETEDEDDDEISFDAEVEEDTSFVDSRKELDQYVDHPFLQRARDAGWIVAQWGQPTRIYREGEDGNISLVLEVVPWARMRGDRFLLDHPAPVLLASRLQQIADTVGITYRRGPGATGHDLLRAVRPQKGGRAEPLAPAQMPAFILRQPKLYSGQAWHRRLTPFERERAYLLTYDTNGSFLSVCGSLRVGRGKVEHRDRPKFDPTLPGYWKVKLPEWGYPGTFDLFGPRHPDEARYYATPTLAYAAKELDIAFQVEEAEVWTDSYRMLEPWYNQLREARKSLPSDVDPTVKATVKAIYTHGIGMFASSKLAGNPQRGIEPADTFRPDVNHHIQAAQQVNMTRSILRIGKATGLWPVGGLTDSLFYAVDDPNFLTAVPGLKLGPDLGSYRPNGGAFMADVLEHLKTPVNKIFEKSLFHSPDEWNALHGFVEEGTA